MISPCFSTVSAANAAFPLRSERHVESLRRSQFFLIVVKSQKRFGPRLQSRSDVQNIKSTMSAGQGMRENRKLVSQQITIFQLPPR